MFGLVNAYLERVRESATGGTIATLAYCFLYFYPAKYPFFENVRQAIRELVNGARSPRARRFQQCDEEVGLFRQKGPQTLADHIMKSGRHPGMVLADSCLAGALGSKGFARYGYTLAVGRMREQLVNQDWRLPALQQLLEWSLDDSGKKGALRFQALRTELVEALLLPFNQANPGPEAQKPIKKFLLDHYGDPRLSKAMWQGVDRDAVGVMYRWLVQSTLEDFFKFLDRLASFDREADRHWKYRRAFWEAYFEAGMIEEAWVAFGPDARREAKHRPQEMGQDYAELQAGSNVTKPNKSRASF